MDTRRFDRHPDRIGRRCSAGGCGAVVHDEAKYCHRCRRTVFPRASKRVIEWWGGIYFPARCERCRRLARRLDYGHCPRCGKKTIPRAYERASVPGAAAWSALLSFVVWAAAKVAVLMLADRNAWRSEVLTPAADIGFAIVGLWLGWHAYHWMRGLRETAPDLQGEVAAHASPGRRA